MIWLWLRGAGVGGKYRGLWGKKTNEGKNKQTPETDKEKASSLKEWGKDRVSPPKRTHTLNKY